MRLHALTWKSLETILALAVLLLAAILVLNRFPLTHIFAALTPPAIASAALSHARGKARSAAALAEAIVHRWFDHPTLPSGLIPYKSGTRTSASTGKIIHVFEYTTPSQTPRGFVRAKGDSQMKDQIITFLTGALLKELQKLMPNLPADADAQISMMVSGGVGLVWDIAKLEGTAELQKLGSGELAKLFPQLFATPAAA